MYDNYYTWANPGLIIFMVDQSASMSQIGYEGRPLAETAADLVNEMICELGLRFFTGDRIKDAAHIVIIGYGSANYSGAKLIQNGSISTLFDDDSISVQHLKQFIPDGVGGELQIEREIKQFVSPEADGVPDMTSAFELANSLINDWKEYCCEDNHRCSSLTPAPLVINVTKGSNNIGDDEKLIKVSNKIKNIEFEDGNPLIVSILIPTHHYFECLSLPVQKVFEENLQGWDRIWWSSSNVPEELKDTFRFAGYFIDVSNESKLIFVNPDYSVKIIDTLVLRPGKSIYDSNIR